ncbi:hypothetical protein LV82_02602 [Albidovulum inexpectatum]|uniref:Uncharacterized protein n=1 Tax=Albidovulum inexpectatum TaxID=196587 RepID=A0A2S5JEJ0_9RHOB|nr:hypothetical protein [Albidovulum inexpectatum]PPB79810.1 hypothetical protein LV82_02602 [Albidovulum inexpectatum]
MKRPRGPLFLARRSYRLRRMMDAARMLPAVGMFLFFLPILWRPADTPQPDTARGWIFLFMAWAVLIALALVLARFLVRAEEEEARLSSGDPLATDQMRD